MVIQRHGSRRLLGGLALGVALAFAASPAAQADTAPPAATGPDHFFDCLWAAFGNPALHAQYCGGNTIPPNNTGLSIPQPAAPSTCHPIASLTRPVGTDAQVASLDDSNLFAAPPAGAASVLANAGCCVSC